MSPHPQQPQKRQIAGLCDGNGSDGQVVLISAVLDSAIRTGHLTISDSEGTHYYGKYQKGGNDVNLNVINDTFWLRILL